MRNLILVPSGGEPGYIESWMQGNPSYHMMLVDYSAEGDAPAHFAQYVHRARGFKMEILYDAIVAHRGLIDSYDAVWLPDGDLQIGPRDIEAMFALFHRLKLCLAQPALIGPNINLPVTRRCPWTRYRYTDFVEVMCPLFSSWALDRVLHTLPMSRSAWGLDWIWADLLPPGSVAILDQIQVYHSKPCAPDGPLYRALARQGVDPRRESRALQGLYQTTSQAQTLRWVFARLGDREIAWGRIPPRRPRHLSPRCDLSPKAPGLSLVLDPDTPPAMLESLFTSLLSAGLEWECLVPEQLEIPAVRAWPKGLPRLKMRNSVPGMTACLSLAAYDRVLFSRGDPGQWLAEALVRVADDDVAAVRAPSGQDLLVSRTAWAAAVRQGLVARLEGTIAQDWELCVALRLAGWTVDGPYTEDLISLVASGTSAHQARQLGEASVWMDGYRLLSSWPFRNWRQRLTLHWWYHMLVEIRALAGPGGSRAQREFRWARLRALGRAGFQHSAWVKNVRQADWRGMRAGRAQS